MRIATLIVSGLVAAVAAGTAVIPAACEGKSRTANVPVASVTVTPAAASLLVSQTVQLTATLKDAIGNVLTGRAVAWGTSAAGVATVSGSGLGTGGAGGGATIT